MLYRYNAKTIERIQIVKKKKFKKKQSDIFVITTAPRNPNRRNKVHNFQLLYNTMKLSESGSCSVHKRLCSFVPLIVSKY